MKKMLLFIGMAIALYNLLACVEEERVEPAEITTETLSVFPDYQGVTIPYNMAPLNFSYLGKEPCCLIVEGEETRLQIKGEKGLFAFPSSVWRELMRQHKGQSVKLTVAIRPAEKWIAYPSFFIHIAADPIDPYLSYRLLPPGYEGWQTMGIYQRNMEGYDQTAIYENKLTNHNCVNCHAYCNGNPEQMMFHARAEFAGTLVVRNGQVEKLKPQPGSLVYPYWHPSGRYIAFSVNKTFQKFFNRHPNRVEVYDSASDVVVYDVQEHQVVYSPLTKSEQAFETFPAFSPDGRSLYFCSAVAPDSMPQQYDRVHYNLCRISFNPENRTFGDRVDTLYHAASEGQSVSFPRISPDGKYLLFTRHAFGNFSIWHKEADLYMLRLQDETVFPLSEANSDDVESYHSWSSNSRWCVFSSRRIDGLYTRPFITYIDADGKAHKPFLLPQKDPLKYYQSLMMSFNIPELMVKKAEVGRHRLVEVLRNEPGIPVSVE